MSKSKSVATDDDLKICNYQPLRKGYRPSYPVNPSKVKPPKGGSGETILNRNKDNNKQ